MTRRPEEETPEQRAARHTALGTRLFGEGRLDDAIRAFRQAVEIRPDYAEGHSDLGAALRRRGDVEGAVAKGAAVAEAVRGRPFHWQGEDIVLDVASAARVLEPGADAEEILAAADQDLVDQGRRPDPDAGPTGA